MFPVELSVSAAILNGWTQVPAIAHWDGLWTRWVMSADSTEALLTNLHTWCIVLITLIMHLFPKTATRSYRPGPVSMGT